MIRFADGEAALFSIKCFIGAMLAYYVALRIGLTRPYWAVTTAYIVSQPLAGAVLSKAVFRLMGTALGGAAAVILVPNFVNSPPVLSLALALWLGLCLYISMLDRTPRAYTFLLAGYTASIIGMPAVNTPDQIFNIAILRVQEITIGILCASLVHGLVFPRSVTHQLFAKVDQVLGDAERWSKAALEGAREITLDRERRRLAVDLGALHQLSTHLPFDTARILPRTHTVRALLDQLTMLLPLSSTVEDRLGELAATPEGIPPPVHDLTQRIGAWLDEAKHPKDRVAITDGFIAEAQALEPLAGEGAPSWADMLLLNLLARLSDLVATHRNARDLVDQMRSPSSAPINDRVADLIAHGGARALHRDRGLAVRAALGTTMTIAIGCTFWITTAWDAGAGAVLIAGVCCALFGNVDDPGPLIVVFLLGSSLGILIAAPFAFAVMPRVTDFVTLAAALAPPLLVLGAMLSMPPPTSLFTLGALIGLLNTIGLNNVYAPDFASFANNAIAQQIGIAFAVITVGLFQTVGVDTSVGRLLRAGFRDVAKRAAGRAPDAALWSGRMLDRIALLVPKLAHRDADPGGPLLDALVDMRIGFVSGELVRFAGKREGRERMLLDDALAQVRDHFRRLDPRRDTAPPLRILTDIDAVIAEFAADAEPASRREGLVLLTSLRRNLFPDAPAYKAAA